MKGSRFPGRGPSLYKARGKGGGCARTSQQQSRTCNPTSWFQFPEDYIGGWMDGWITGRPAVEPRVTDTGISRWGGRLPPGATTPHR